MFFFVVLIIAVVHNCSSWGYCCCCFWFSCCCYWYGCWCVETLIVVAGHIIFCWGQWMLSWGSWRLMLCLCGGGWTVIFMSYPATVMCSVVVGVVTIFISTILTADTATLIAKLSQSQIPTLLAGLISHNFTVSHLPSPRKDHFSASST